MAFSFLLTSDLLAPLPLELAPDGWAGMRYLFQRDMELFGVALTMSSDLTFWKQGAAYLRTLYEGGALPGGALVPAQGIEAVAVLNVYEVDPNEFRRQVVYRGRVDFTQYRAAEGGGVQIKTKELGLATNLLTRAESPVDLLGTRSLSGTALAPLAPATVALHSQVLRLQYAATNRADHELSPGLMSGNGEDRSHEQLLYFGFDTPGDNDLKLGAVAGGFVAGDAASVVAIYTAQEDGPFTVELDLRARVEAHNNGQGPGFGTVEGDCYLRFVRGGVTEAHKIAPDFKQEGLDGDFAADLLTGPQTFAADLKVGDAIFLYARYFVHDIGGLGTTFRYRTNLTATVRPGSYLRITALSTTPATNCQGLLAHEALQRLSEGMADAPGGFYSEHYGRPDTYPAYAADGPGALRLLTSGFLLRGFPLPDARVVVQAEADTSKPFTAAFRAVYDSLNAVDCLGAGFEQRGGRPTLRVEPRAYFFQPTETLRLGAVGGLTKAPYPPLIYNEVQAGYQRWQSGAAVGLDECNGSRTYAAPITQQKATYAALSPAVAAGYLIEQARRQRYLDGPNAEGPADNDLFLICLRREGGTGRLVTEKAEAFARVTGTLAPATAYNLRLSPGRNLRRHGPFIRAGLVPQAAAGKRLLRGAVQGSDKLVTQLLGEAAPVDEHADVPLTDLAAPLFAAETYEFTARLRRQQLRRLSAAPYGLISFLDGAGQRKRGYLLKAEIEPATGKATFTLLRAAAS